MAEMKKINHETFKDYYEGINGNKKVCCILDSYCVRYMVFINGRLATRREYDNGNKALCLRRAEAALNR